MNFLVKYTGTCFDAPNPTFYDSGIAGGFCHTLYNNSAATGTIEAEGHALTWIPAKDWSTTTWSESVGTKLTKYNSGAVMTPEAFNNVVNGAKLDSVVRASWY